MRDSHRLRPHVALLMGVTFALVGCGGSTGSSSDSSKAPIEVGVAAGITGYLAASDGPLTEGVKLAVDRVNKSGGADGHQINLHVLDVASTASTGVTVVNQLMNQYNTSVILTGALSAGTAAYVPIVGPRQVPLITDTVLPTDPKWVVSVLPWVDHIVQREMDFASKDLHAKTVGVMYSQTPYGQQASKAISDQAGSYGLTVPVNVGVDTTSTDVSPILARIRDAKADAIITVLTGPIELVVAKNAASLGLSIPVIQAIDDVAIYKASAASYPNTYFTGTAPQFYPNVSDAKRKAADKAFMDEWSKSHGDITGVTGALAGWDEIQILVAAVKSSHATSGEALRAALEKTSIVGTTTDYNFTPSDHTGQQKVPNPLYIGQFKNGTITALSQPPTK